MNEVKVELLKNGVDQLIELRNLEHTHAFRIPDTWKTSTIIIMFTKVDKRMRILGKCGRWKTSMTGYCREKENQHMNTVRDKFD